MSAQLQPIGTATFAFAFLAVGLGANAPVSVALAVDCLAAPNSPAPPGSHWYYHTDRTQDRKCWHLRTDNAPSEQEAVQIVREAPAKSSLSVAAGAPYAGPGLKESVAQHEGAKPSVQDVEKLYADFLEWKRRGKN